ADLLDDAGSLVAQHGGWGHGQLDLLHREGRGAYAAGGGPCEHLLRPWGTGSFICCTERSEWHTPLAATLTTTSSARGGLSSSASTLRASWKLKSTAPRTMVRLPAFDRAHRYRPGPKEGSSDAGDRRLQRGPIPFGAVR